jgi:hypothetical protein
LLIDVNDNFNPIHQVPVIASGDKGSGFNNVIEEFGATNDAVTGG